MNFKIFLFFIFLVYFINCKAQFVLDAKLNYGYVLPLYDAIEYVVNTNVVSSDITILKESKGSDFWEILYKYPSYGLGISFGNLGNNKIYGYATSLYFCFDYILLKNKIYNFSSRFNLGYSYISKKFDLYDNYLNRAIGSHHNIFIRISANVSINFLKNSKLLFDCSLTHYSNGKMKSPNYGLNIFSFSTGFRFNFNSNNAIYNNAIFVPEFKKFSHLFIFSGGSKVYDNLLNVRYKFFTATYQLIYRKSWLKQFGCGVSIFYDESIGEAINKDVGIYDKRFKIRFRIAPYVAKLYQFKNVMFHLMAGYYVYSKFTDLTPIFTRLFLQYYLNKNFSIGLGIKAHMAKADMLEWGIGFKL